MKSLVAYFSASGVTKSVAERLAKAAGADIFEIEPLQPYTKEDLNWMDSNSRSTLEMKDKNCRPQMAKTCNISKYDVVFIGFPVWWYREPSIIDTFMESADFSGKVVIPFCTSGSSGMGDSADNIQKLAPGATVLNGERFAADVSEDELFRWTHR